MSEQPQQAGEPRANRQRRRREQVAGILAKLLGSADETMLQRVEAEIDWVRLAGGEILFRQDDPPDDVYVLVSGRLRAVQRTDDGAERVLNEMAPGQTVGEMGMITGEARSASVCAIRDSELVRLSRSACERISGQYPQVMTAIARILIDRLRRKERGQPVGRPATNVAVLPLGADVPLGQLVDRFVRALSALGSVLRLSSERLDALLRMPGAAQIPHDEAEAARIGAWLDEQESAHRFVVYQADRSASAWTRRCVRQADRILLAAQAGADPAPSEIETALFGPGRPITTAGRSLVLLHPDGGRLPSGTGRWLSAREVDSHYHIRWDTDADFARLARCLGGRAVGLVLSGGGARGFAHVGVIRALREAGVPIDLVGGASMGAILATQIGMDWDHDRILRMCRENFIERKPHKEYTLPLISVIRSRRLDHLARSVFGDVRIEDLWVGYYCVSCNLTTSEMVVHRRGPLWKAVRASASLPGVFVPVVDGPNLLVDGGVLNCLPGDIMREISCGPVIVVNASGTRDLTADYQEFPSPWRLLWDRALPFRRRGKFPSILDILARTATVSSDRRAAEVETDADLCLRPPVTRFGLMEFEALDEIVEVAYRYTKQRIAEVADEEWFRRDCLHRPAK